VEAARHQRLDPLLCGKSTERSEARIPPRAELDVRRQAGVDKALGVGNRPPVNEQLFVYAVGTNWQYNVYRIEGIS
jgi:hypothetical protein